MVIKKRPAEDEERAAAIDAFAGGATPAASLPPAPRVEPPPASSKPVALTLLVRFPDQDLPLRLQRLADADERSKHYVALRALEAGVALLEAEEARER